MKAVLPTLVVLSRVAAADPIATGKLDVWDGPFPTLEAATAKDVSPAVEIELTEIDDDALVQLGPIDGLVAQRREVVRCGARDPSGCDDREHLEYRLAAQTSAGWFTSGQLGVHENRDRCEVIAVTGSGSRFSLRYRCDVGRFDWASKEFLLACGVDAQGRVACGRTVVSARHSVNRGGKSDTATDVIHDTLSCRPKIAGDVVRLVPRKPDRSGDEATRHVTRLAKCAGPTRFPLAGPYTPGTHLPPPLFDEAGRWRKP